MIRRTNRLRARFRAALALSPLLAPWSLASDPDWRFEIVDGNGDPTPARVVAFDPAQHAYLVPEGSLSWLMNDQPGRYRGAEYFYTNGAFTLNTSADSLGLCVRKGLEYAIVERKVMRSEAPTTIRMRRAIDMTRKGYFSGDGHIHPVGGQPDWARVRGRRSFHNAKDITNELLLTIVQAEDLAYANLLSSNSTGDEVHMADRVTGRNEPESDHAHILRVSEEYRSEVYGHMSVFGIIRPSDPVFTGLIGSKKSPLDYPTNHEACLKYKADGAFPSFAHLRRQKNIALEFPVDVALGSLNAVEIQGYMVGWAAADLWEKLMSCGFDVVITAGTDSVLTVVKNLPVGGDRVYVDLGGRPFTHDAWVAGLAKGHAFTTNGAMLFLTVDGNKPGDTIAIEGGEPHVAPVEIIVESLFPWETVTVRMNGTDVLEFKSAAGNPRRQRFEGKVTLWQPAWVRAHLKGPIIDHVLGGTNPWWTPTHDAFTNAIWVTSVGRLRRDAESCDFMIDWIRDNLAALEKRDNYGSPENRRVVRATFARALKVFEQRKAEAGR